MNIGEENNQALVTGEVITDFTFSHKSHGENFYKVTVKVPRLSQAHDIIPIIVSDKLVDVSADWIGSWIMVSGQYRSNNKYRPDGSRKLELFVFAFYIIPVLPEDLEAGQMNEVTLSGCLCRPPIYRETPEGRKITDMLLAVNRAHGKTDYIPCICWGRNAVYISGFGVGTCLTLEGRIQSRDYKKILKNGSVEIRTAWEVSASTVQVLEQEETQNG